MINFKYEHISEIMRLADEEIRRLESEKEISYPRKSIPSIDEEYNAINNAGVEELEERISLLKQVKDGFAQELKKISFSFGMGDKPNDNVKYAYNKEEKAGTLIVQDETEESKKRNIFNKQ
jgi:hypothetical protein